ncbi:HTTM domain-containing protein [Galbibacter mesophilus]|uniref:HTTM domain-containing protein n=1 Tax=Galbibacter mesophilus TaxID=379069 RepID=UPI00191EBFFF|nr:HTTM domain-containing protein [Galbibacter mesophilus]MCM5663933.1 HTTM domain-containing protein [Galbibacter mesophilus]
MNNSIKRYLSVYTETAPLAVFRIFFGVMMFLSIVRFWSKGWIEQLYIQPKFFFSYYGFEWVKPFGVYTYVLFGICALAALAVAFGYKYRMAIILFFLSFTYIELMDKTTYLNHYYFISLLSFIMIFLPANAYFSLDAKQGKSFGQVPKWTIDSIKLLLSIVYIYAGLAKLNSDWILRAMPLKIWLPTQYDLPVIGSLLKQEWMLYLLSWCGALYDLLIPFFLLNKKTRPYAFAAVVFFHVLTRIFFPIGMFPFIMIVSALIFFDARVHHKIIKGIQYVFRIKKGTVSAEKLKMKKTNIIVPFLAFFFFLQLLIPWRYVLYPGELFWTEEGFRFSWRVMLIEKTGYVQFKIVDGDTGKWFYVDNSDFLTPFQEKEMAAQADFILEYAHYLGNHFASQGHENLEVYVESFITLNGRRSERFIDSTTNLLTIKESFRHKDWILPFKDEIKGL